MYSNIAKRPLIILDFGSQYTQLLARRVREMCVYCEIHPYNIAAAVFHSLSPCGVILSGGPASATNYTTATLKAPPWLFNLKLPILGICYGMQTMAVQLGGKVESSAKREFGYAQVALHGKSSLLANIEDSTTPAGAALLDVWMSHGDEVLRLPPGFNVICATTNTPIAGMANEEKHMYGLQFHPEVHHTLQGRRILQRFVLDLCKADNSWTAENILESTINSIRQRVGNAKVLLALSGGVDSSVVAVLLQRAIGDQLVCVFVDSGLLRQDEAAEINTMFAKHLGINVITADGKNRFLHALAGVNCPETKRKIIGHMFIEIFTEQARQLPAIEWLAQGTIYPDVIESAALQNAADLIKTHHNVGGLPKILPLKLLEPLRHLFKDEVRHLGLELGLPLEMVYRHPFPGPGLAVRVLGEVKKKYLTLLRHADAIFMAELNAANLYNKVSQAFAVFLPIKSVGVMGDARRYEYVICLRAVETDDFMTATWAQLPWDFLAKVSNRIINEVQGISRVTYDISGKPPATIEWE